MRERAYVTELPSARGAHEARLAEGMLFLIGNFVLEKCKKIKIVCKTMLKKRFVCDIIVSNQTWQTEFDLKRKQKR